MTSPHQPELPALPTGIAARLLQSQRDALAQYVLAYGQACATHAASRPADGDWVMVPREVLTEASAVLGHAYHTTLTGELAELAHDAYQSLDAILNEAR